MKLKMLLLFLLMGAVQQGALRAEEKQIKTNVDEWKELTRSLFNAPSLSHDGNTIYIYSYLPLQNMEVTVTDASGCVVYYGMLSCVEVDQTISFTFGDTSSGMYMIEVSHGGKYLCGWFEVLPSLPDN